MNRGIIAALLALPMGGCQDGYPIAATHCDHFCRAIERATCGQDPVQCVLACEQEASVAAAGCDRELDALLSCVGQLPLDQLPCSPNPFWLRDNPSLAFNCTVHVGLLQACRANNPPTMP